MLEKIILGISERPAEITLLASSLALVFAGTTRLKWLPMIVRLRIVLIVLGLVFGAGSLFLMIFARIGVNG